MTFIESRKKVILSMSTFQDIGYLEKCRYDKQPLKIHNLGTQVISSEIAQIYFSRE